MANILCPIDFSEISARAIAYAELVAHRFLTSVTLFHAMEKQETRGDGHERVHATMEEQRRLVTMVPVEAQFRPIDFMHGIAEESGNGHALMVCATHGPHGLKQSLFGSDMLKLVRKVKVPSLVVQGHSPLPNHFGTIVMPVAAHTDIDHLLEAVTLLAKPFGSTVHIYRLIRPGEEPSEALLRNKDRMESFLRQKQVPFINAEEPSHAFSVGFSGATIAYAERVNAGCIAIMSVASEEYRYIADAEKERLLTNPKGIPVLCAA